jgi:hypothetical protein
VAVTIRLTGTLVELQLGLIRVEQSFSLVVPGEPYPANDDTGEYHVDAECLF